MLMIHWKIKMTDDIFSIFLKYMLEEHGIKITFVDCKHDTPNERHINKEKV